MQTPILISDRHIWELEQREDPGDAKSVSPTIKTNYTQCIQSPPPNNGRRPTTAGALVLPSSPSFLLLLSAVIFAAFASSSSSFVHAAATTTTSDVQTEEEETASAWSEGSSRGVQEDKLQDEDELTTTTSLSRWVDRTVLKLREENRALEAENSVLKGERDAYTAHVESALDLRARLDKWEPKKWMSAARSATAGTSSATQANVDLSTTLTLPTFEERHLASVGSDVVPSSSDDVARVGGRRLVASCPTFLYADDAALAASNGWNLLSVSCTLGAQIFVNGARMKIKKDPSAEGVVEVDRQATSENKGRHFYVVNGAVLEVEGLTLTGGYANVRFLFFFYSSSSE